MEAWSRDRLAAVVLVRWAAGHASKDFTYNRKDLPF